MTLPDATPKPCDECPFRTTSIPRYLGPHSAEEWAVMIQGEGPIACHKTIRDVDDGGTGSWDHPNIRQCRGAASLRANLCKSPRNHEVVTGPVDDACFGGGGHALTRFLEHHGGDLDEYRRLMFGVA